MPSTYCCVPECHLRGGHSFPSDQKTRQKWITAIKRMDEESLKNWEPSKSAVVCHAHFKPDDYAQQTTDDIWDDFDDCGIKYIPTVTSPVLSSPPDASDKVPACDVTPSNTATDRLLLQDGEDSFVITIEDDPTPEGTSGVPESKERTFETPSFKKRREDLKRPWTAPLPFTPKPEYAKMATPVLKKAVQRIGVKAVGKKRMIKLQDDVNDQTHQYIWDDFDDCDIEYTPTFTSPVLSSPPDASDKVPKAVQRIGVKAVGKKRTTKLQDDVNDQTHQYEIIYERVPSKERMSSQYSDTSELSEKRCHNLISSGRDVSSSPQKSSDENRSLFDFIKKRPELNNRILMYDPLELDVLKKDVEEAGIKCSMDKLTSFLDEKCIVYRKRNTREGENS